MHTLFQIVVVLVTLNACESHFQLSLQWTHVNYTWRSSGEYSNALSTGRYVPENNAPSGMKIFEDKLYLSVPRLRSGVPVTLAYVQPNSSYNPLLVPFPSWEANDISTCANLQSVQSMEIDTRGVMWVLDGVRINNNTHCPSKLILLNLKAGGKIVHVYTFPNELALREGGFLNDLVVDETDDEGDFAYITDNSQIDPGLLVYSRSQDKAWKLRDASMFSQLEASNFKIKGDVIKILVSIDGIALSPKVHYRSKCVFYCSVTSYNLYAISTTILKDEDLCKTSDWRRNIENLGTKRSQSDGIVVDSAGQLYYTALPLYGVAKWNISTKTLLSSILIDRDANSMIWTDGFAFDQKGYIYLISNSVYKYVLPDYKLELTDEVKFRIHKLYTGTKSYQYS